MNNKTNEQQENKFRMDRKDLKVAFNISTEANSATKH